MNDEQRTSVLALVGLAAGIAAGAVLCGCDMSMAAGNEWGRLSHNVKYHYDDDRPSFIPAQSADSPWMRDSGVGDMYTDGWQNGVRIND